MMNIMKVGLFLENNVLPYSKLTKQEHQGILLCIETVHRVPIPVAPFSQPCYHWAPSTILLILKELKIFIFQHKQNNQDFPIIRGILNKDKIRLLGLP